MSVKKKSVQKKTKARQEYTVVKPVCNKKIKIPKEVRQCISKRQKEEVEECLAKEKILNSRAMTPQEAQKKSELLIKIAQKLGIFGELEALKDLKLTRNKRARKILDTYGKYRT